MDWSKLVKEISKKNPSGTNGKSNSDMVDIRSKIPVITLNINRLNIPIKRSSLADYIRIKQLHTAYMRYTLKQGHRTLKVKQGEEQ